ncbi:hypothetical protein C8A01DRAFT_45385 [Parachaetomium inaequale]|uniref:MARVEL domain-containing protein n=1 Tax=Parachaetomium inaequale TaxID=2588326 RepID=A0AAN6SSZ5_9PEZI|nr:hypothetical protein C8A01DRAFT_45385 [Parachaetomium inaequale]
MPPTVRDTLSLRPRGFYAYVFLTARVAQIICLGVITGIVGNFLFIATRGRQPAPANLIVVIMFTSSALVWTLFSWTGFSRRYLPYAATWCADLVLLVPFAALTVVLGLPMADANCAAVAQDGEFEITAPPGSSVGRVAFAQDGRTACFKLFAVWVLLIVVCGLLAVSALSIGFLHLGEKQLAKAIFAMTADKPRGGSAGSGGYYSEGMNESRGRREFVPTPRARPGPGEVGGYGYNNPTAASRPSIDQDRLNLNRPITLAPARGGTRAFAGGPGYGEPLGQPAAARMPRLGPDEASQMAAVIYRQETQNTGTRGGWRKVTPSGEGGNGASPARPAGLGNVTMSSARGQPQSSRTRAGPAKAMGGGNDGFNPVASLPPQSASFGKVPIGNRMAPLHEAADGKGEDSPSSKGYQRKEPGNANRQDPRGGTPMASSPQGGFEGVPGTTSQESGATRNPHESLMPKPLAIGQNGKSGRQRARDKETESGWWGALASVIYRPQAEYDPSNVV